MGTTAKHLVGSVGTVLGLLSKAQVNESIAWVQKFNVASEEYDVPGFAGETSQRVSDLSKGELDLLDEKGYLFFVKHTGDTGTYLNDSRTSERLTSDYAFIENTRTIEKAIRECRVSLLPQLNSPLSVTEEGLLASDTIKHFENLVKRPLERMQSRGELSSFEVSIDALQNVLSTSEIKLDVRLQPRGVARNIKVSIGFATKLEG